MGRKPGVEYGKELIRENHDDSCRVWDGWQWRDACNCGAVQAPETRKLEGYSRYEFLENMEVRDLTTGRLLGHQNERNAVSLIGDDGKRKQINVTDAYRLAFGG